ncbi:hypothetical protein WJX77_000516 [Trebouxia sp. C0004]
MPAFWGRSTVINHQAAQKHSLAGRLVRGLTPMVTYPATALSNRMMSGLHQSRAILTAAKWVGKGVLDYASLAENRQHFKLNAECPTSKSTVAARIDIEV